MTLNCHGCGVLMAPSESDYVNGEPVCFSCCETWPCECRHAPEIHSVGDDEGGPGPCRACDCGCYFSALSYSRLRVVPDPE